MVPTREAWGLFQREQASAVTPRIVDGSVRGRARSPRGSALVGNPFGYTTRTINQQLGGQDASNGRKPLWVHHTDNLPRLPLTPHPACPMTNALVARLKKSGGCPHGRRTRGCRTRGCCCNPAARSRPARIPSRVRQAPPARHTPRRRAGNHSAPERAQVAIRAPLPARVLDAKRRVYPFRSAGARPRAGAPALGLLPNASAEWVAVPGRPQPRAHSGDTNLASAAP